jgi:hypothetical protein
MTDTSVLRAEITAALSIVSPQVRGLDDLSRSTLAPSSAQAVAQVLVTRKRRQKLLNDVVTALDTLDRAVASLEADGHPELPTVFVSDPILSDLAEERADLTSALGIFQLDRAIRLVIRLGDPELKLNP